MVLSVQFDHCGRKFELRQAWPAVMQPPRDGFERVEPADALPGPWPAVPRSLMSCDPWRLRALAEEVDGGPGVLQQRDAQVHAAVARLLHQGRLRLYELTRRHLLDEQEAEVPQAASPVFTPSMLREAPSPEPAPAEAAAAATPLLIDQDRQAAVLRRAAASGVPFCEECERRAQRQPRQPQHEAAALEPA
jgi:hypothetical protein